MAVLLFLELSLRLLHQARVVLNQRIAGQLQTPRQLMDLNLRFLQLIRQSHFGYAYAIGKRAVVVLAGVLFLAVGRRARQEHHSGLHLVLLVGEIHSQETRCSSECTQ